MSDPECVNMIYIQAVSDVVTSRYPANEKDVTVLAALQLQATHGDFKKDVHVAGWLTPKLHEFMPKDLLMKKGKASSKLEKEWEQMVRLHRRRALDADYDTCATSRSLPSTRRCLGSRRSRPRDRKSHV